MSEDRDRDTITVWPGKDGWELIDELEDLADENGQSRNQAILDAISLYLEVQEVLVGTEVWDEAGTSDRRIMLHNALREYRDSW